MKFLAWCFAFICLAAVLSRCNKDQTTTPAIVDTPKPPLPPHEQRLADLHKQREGLESTVTGYLFHALTGHHHTSVLFQVVGIEQWTP
jgi:hypothetical protein